MPVQHPDLGEIEGEDSNPTLYKKLIQNGEAVVKNKLNNKASSEHTQEPVPNFGKVASSGYQSINSEDF